MSADSAVPERSLRELSDNLKEVALDACLEQHREYTREKVYITLALARTS
jgi:hypothetical protein